MKNVVAYSLWGELPMFWFGAQRNIEIVGDKLPGFICRFYIDSKCPQHLIDSLQGDHVEKVIVDNNKEEFYGPFWRFWAADDPEVDVMLSRDTDSRIDDRELAAINEWLASDKDFHIMRDHPYHGVPILAGMWGCRNGILKNLDITKKISEWTQFHRKGVDQDFLDKVIYPKVRDNAVEHDDWGRYGVDVKKFPTGRINGGFVGEIYNELDVRHPDHWKLIK